MTTEPGHQLDSHHVVAHALIREAAASVALDGETYVVDDFDVVSVDLVGADPEPAGITVDVGEVVPDPVDDVGVPPPDVGHRARPPDLLAVGLAHRHPDVVAAAQVARLAIDQLVTQLQRHPTPGAPR